MKFLDSILDRALEASHGTRLQPVVDAMDTFLRHPIHRPEHAPYLRQGMDAKRFMFTVVLAVLPALAGSVYFFGPRVLLMILVSYAAGGLVEVGFAAIRRHPINEGFLVTGLLLPLTLPVGIPLWMIALGSAFGVFFGKEVFGGVGQNVFNPALVGRAFLFLSFPKQMSTGWIIPSKEWWVGGALGRLVEEGAKPVADVITSATPMITTKLAVNSGGSATETVLHSFSNYQLATGWVGGSVGETSAVLIVLGALFLFSTRVANWRAPVASLVTMAALSELFSILDPTRFMPPLPSIMAGGFLFGTVFMLTDPVTSPSTNMGRYVYGAGVGLLVVLIRGLSGYPEGVMFSILIMNVFAPLIDQGALLYHRRKIARRPRYV